MTPCKMCRDHYKGKRPAHFGSDPKCAFPDGGPFTADNWNCITANALTALAGDRDADKPPGSIQREQQDDQTYITIYTHDVEFPSRSGADDESDSYWCLWATWYKSRGRTGNMLLLGDEVNPVPRPPTEADALAILALYSPEVVARRRKWWMESGHSPAHCPYGVPHPSDPPPWPE